MVDNAENNLEFSLELEAEPEKESEEDSGLPAVRLPDPVHVMALNMAVQEWLLGKVFGTSDLEDCKNAVLEKALLLTYGPEIFGWLNDLQLKQQQEFQRQQDQLNAGGH